MRSLVLVAFFALAALARPAHADADPALGYVFGSFAVPYHVAVKHSSEFNTQEFGKAKAGVGLQSLGFGLGIGYDGWNAQLDVRSALDATAGALTAGYRLNLQFGNVEVWARAGVGPALVLDYKHPTDTTRSAAGGIQTILEGGVDYFFWKETMAVGLKGVAAPSYTFPTTVAADFGLNLGIRLLI